jgi:hypothetical protein
VRSTVPDRLLLIVALLSAVPTAEVAAQPPLPHMATTTAPDLRLEWIVAKPAASSPSASLPPPAELEPRRPAVEPLPIEGRAGESVRLRYRIRNVGATDAFAVVIRVQTGLGSVGRPTRVEPGPEAGKAIERALDLPLAVGLAEVCVIAVLQTLRADDPRDPFTDDNRICRRANVRPADAEAIDTTASKGEVQ